MFYQHRSLASILFPGLAAAVCECGYQTNTGDIWQYSIVTDFNTTDTAAFSASEDWDIVDIVRTNGTKNPYALAYTPDNVVVRDAALQLTCSAYVDAPNKTIYAAEIITTRDDIRYGSFRSRHSVVGGGGAVAALFFYADDANEIDIELVTDDPVRVVHLTHQPDDEPGETIETYMPSNIARTSMTSYRFDWFPAQTSFYVNDIPSGNLSKGVPAINGSIELNSWANGGSFAGQDVPTTDSVMSIEWIHLYFNTSSASTAKKWKSACAKAKVAACLVDSDGLGTNQTSTLKSSQTSGASSARLVSWSRSSSWSSSSSWSWFSSS